MHTHIYTDITEINLKPTNVWWNGGGYELGGDLYQKVGGITQISKRKGYGGESQSLSGTSLFPLQQEVFQGTPGVQALPPTPSQLL